MKDKLSGSLTKQLVLKLFDTVLENMSKQTVKLDGDAEDDCRKAIHSALDAAVALPDTVANVINKSLADRVNSGQLPLEDVTMYAARSMANAFIRAVFESIDDAMKHGISPSDAVRKLRVALEKSTDEEVERSLQA